MKEPGEDASSAFRPLPSAELAATAFALETGAGCHLYSGLGQADLAHAIHLSEIGVVPRRDAVVLIAGLLEMHRIAPEAFAHQPELGDVYTNRLHHLRRLIGPASGWLSAGRPRREATTIAYFLSTRQGLLAVLDELTFAQAALLRLAGDHLATILPDYTYLQPAHPTTLAHYLLTFASPVSRDFERLQLAFRHTQQSPAGAGSTNGSRLPFDRERLAELLGFREVLAHTRDAMWPADQPIEVLSALAAVLTNAGRLAEDLMIFATAEFGFVSLSAEHTRSSVIMPQKKNPYALAYLRGAAREIIGTWTAAVVHQATPSGQVDNRIFVYKSVPEALGVAGRALKLLASILDGIELDTERMAQRAAEDFTGATDLAEMLMVEHGVDWETAHDILSRAVRSAAEARASLDSTTVERAAAAVGHPLELEPRQVESLLDPSQLVASRTGIGGASSISTRALIDRLETDLETVRSWSEGQRAHLRSAEEALLARARELCQAT